MSGLVVAVMDENGQEVELAFPESFLGLKYKTVVKRFSLDGYVLQVDTSERLDLFGAATVRENLVATYKADGYEWCGDLVWQKSGVPGYVSIYIEVDERVK